MSALTDEQNARLRAIARHLLVETYGENESDLARAIDASPSWVSRFIAGQIGTSLSRAKRLASLAGADAGALLEIEPPSERRAKGAPRLGDHPDWPEAERQIREGRGGNKISEQAWIAARSTSGGPTLPRHLRLSDVRQLAELWQEAIDDAAPASTPQRPWARPEGAQTATAPPSQAIEAPGSQLMPQSRSSGSGW